MLYPGVKYLQLLRVQYREEIQFPEKVCCIVVYHDVVLYIDGKLVWASILLIVYLEYDSTKGIPI